MRAWIVAAALALAACSSAPAATPAAPPPIVSAPMAAEPPAQLAADACGAQALLSLIGQPRSEIPVPLNPSRQRVACTACPLTQDYDPQRLNFLFDADSGLIREIR